MQIIDVVSDLVRQLAAPIRYVSPTAAELIRIRRDNDADELVLGGSMANPVQISVSGAKNDQIIEALAKENEVAVERVREIFEIERSRLDADARVKTFVSVIATRLVRNALQAKQ